MQPIAHLVKVSVPNYLAGLPIPDSIGGWFRLGVRDWISLIPPTALLAGVSYVSYKAFNEYRKPPPRNRINPMIRLGDKKVVDTVDVEDITEKAVFCRCWKSQTWPYCDGAHGPHNRENGDNIGPVVVKRKV